MSYGSRSRNVYWLCDPWLSPEQQAKGLLLVLPDLLGEAVTRNDCVGPSRRRHRSSFGKPPPATTGARRPSCRGGPSGRGDGGAQLDAFRGGAGGPATRAGKGEPVARQARAGTARAAHPAWGPAATAGASRLVRAGGAGRGQSTKAKDGPSEPPCASRPLALRAAASARLAEHAAPDESPFGSSPASSLGSPKPDAGGAGEASAQEGDAGFQAHRPTAWLMLGVAVALTGCGESSLRQTRPGGTRCGRA